MGHCNWPQFNNDLEQLMQNECAQSPKYMREDESGKSS
jgi:hypothetical protein